MDFGDQPLGIRSHVATLSSLLRQSWVLRVPRFQRPYSWTDKEVGRLLEDLRIALKRDYPFYFMGTIVFIYEEGGDAADLVDGQQRLTTFTILLASVRDRLQDPKAKAAIQEFIKPAQGGGLGARLRLRPIDQAFFTRYVITPGAIDSLCQLKDVKDQQAGMAHAARVIADALADIIDEGVLEAFAGYVISRVGLNVIETTDRDGAVRLFKSLNDPDRECDLSAQDMMRSDLFEQAALPEEEAEACAQDWDELSEQLGRRTMDELLDHMPEIYSAQSLPGQKEISVMRRRFLSEVDAAEFLRTGLRRYGEVLAKIRTASFEEEEAGEDVLRRLRCLQLLKDERMWVAPALALLTHGPADKDFLRRYLVGLERLVWAAWMGVVRSERRIERFTKVLRAGFEERALFGPGGALELTDAERRGMIDRLNDPFKGDRSRRRIIVLRTNAAIAPFYETLSLTDDANVEHILPEKPTGPWLDLFPATIRDLYTHILGNHTLLTLKQNTLADRRPFVEKRKIYFETRGAPLRALTATLRDVYAWTPDELRKRHEYLVKALSADFQLTDVRG